MPMQGKSGENTAIPKPRILRLPALAIPRGRLRARLVILGTLFVMTGCTGLLAEQAFEKLLGTLLGASTPAAAVVLSVYFLGLSLGAAGYARIFRGVRDPLRVYAFLEGGVALWSLLLFLGFGWLVPAFAPLLRLAAGSFPSLQAARFLVAVCWILPPTFLMGASFLVDGLVCLAVLWLGQAVARTGAPRIQAPAALARPLKELPPAAWVLIGIAALSGFSFFSLEVFWVHLISAVLGNSVYAFAAMLALVLTGLLLGGMIATALLPRRRQVPGWLPGAIYLAASATLLWQFGRWDGIPHQFTIWGAGLTTFAQSQVLCWIQAGIQILPLAVLMGTVYPLLFRLEGFPGHSRAAFAGLLAAANSVGCITGALFTGFLLIPWLGSETGLTLIGAGCVVAGWLLCFASSGLRARILASTAALGMAGLWFFAAPWNQLALTSGEHVYFRPFQVFPGTKLLFFQEDTSGGMTTVVRNLAGSRDKPKPYLTLLTNGKFQGNDSEEVDAQTGFALIPMLHAHAFDTACVIGLGTGRTAQAVNAMGFSSIHIAEIAPAFPRRPAASSRRSIIMCWISPMSASSSRMAGIFCSCTLSAAMTSSRWRSPVSGSPARPACTAGSSSN